jgi:hypothetical protein
VAGRGKIAPGLALEVKGQAVRLVQVAPLLQRAPDRAWHPAVAGQGWRLQQRAAGARRRDDLAAAARRRPARAQHAVGLLAEQPGGLLEHPVRKVGQPVQRHQVGTGAQDPFQPVTPGLERADLLI